MYLTTNKIHILLLLKSFSNAEVRKLISFLILKNLFKLFGKENVGPCHCQISG